MPDARILELQTLLTAATDNLAQLRQSNADLTRQLADAEMRNKKLKRNSRNDESALKQQITDAQNRRF
jgi:F0F1-type ATP synthase membrane subunit b/b'